MGSFGFRGLWAGVLGVGANDGKEEQALLISRLHLVAHRFLLAMLRFWDMAGSMGRDYVAVHGDGVAA